MKNASFAMILINEELHDEDNQEMFCA